MEELLEMVQYEFVTKIYSTLIKQGEVYMTLPGNFDNHFTAIFKRWEIKSQEL